MGALDTVADNSVLLGSICLFTVIYFYGYYFIFQKIYKGQARFDAASCGISLCHGTVVAILSCSDIFRHEWVLDAPNTLFQNRVMEYSMAYFIVDLLNYFITAPDDYLFIGHHIATLTYMISCRYFVHHGATSVMCLIAAGELTSPVQNIWTLARMAREDSPQAKKIYTTMSPFFTVLFTLVRGGFGPYLTWRLGKFYLGGHADAVIPRWLACCWMFKISFAIFGSMVWVYGQLASSNCLPLLCVRGHFKKLLSPHEDGYLQKMILLKKSLRHLCGIGVSPSRNSVVMKLMLNSDTSQCNNLMPCYIHPSCNGSRSGGSPKQQTLNGYGALQKMLRMSTIENLHPHQNQIISLDTINELERLNDCLRGKFVSKVAQQVDAPDLAYYFFRWAGRQTLFHKNINTHHSINEILGGPGKLDMQVQQQLLQVMCSRSWSACTSAFQAQNIIQSGYYECYGYVRGLTSKLVIGLGIPRKLLSGERCRALHVGAGSSVRACQGNLIVTKELGKLGSQERRTMGKGKVRIRGKERLRREVGILAKILRSKKTWGAKTAKLLKDSNVEVLPYHVCEVLRVHHNSVDKALKFFNWAKQQKRCKRGNFMFTKMIKLLGDAGQFDEIWPLLDDMKKEGRVIPPSLFLGVIRSYVQVKKLDEAMATFHAMEKYGCQPNTLIFNCMIDIFRKVGDVAKVEELFKNMDRVPCAPDIYTFSMLIDCKGKCGDVDTAFDLFQEMHKKGYKANVFTYSSLIDSLGKAGRFAEACNLLRGMKINGCDPNDVTYTTLIGGLGQAGQASLAYFYYKEMLSLGFVPTPVTYAVVIACTIQLDKETEAHSLFHIAMVRNKFSEFDVLKSVLGRLCKSGHWEAALKFFEDMKKNGVEPSTGAYDVLIHHLPKTGNVDKAFDIFREISGKGACPDLVALTSLTRGLVKERKLSAAMDVIQYMTKQGLSADIYMYGNLVNFLCQSGRFNDAFQVVTEEMKERSCPPNVHTYNKLIDNLGKAGRVHEAWEAFERMGQQDCAPDAVTYNTVIGILGNVGKVDTAHHLFKQMKEKGLEPTKYTYNIMIGILVKAGQAKLGAELFKEMVEHHIAPSEVTHKVLLQAHDETFGGYSDLLNECKKGMLNLHDSASTDAGGSQHVEIEPCTSR